MSPREPFWYRYRHLLRRDIARDVDDELDHHLQLLVEKYLADGLSPAEAGRRAGERMGDLDRAREACRTIDARRHRRAQRKERLAGLGQDLRYAARGLIRTPAFTAVAAITLALGIGANTAVFSLVRGVLLRPLPYRQPDRLVRVWSHNLVRGQGQNVVNPGNALDWERRARSFSGLALFYAWHSLTFTGGDRAEQVSGFAVTPNYFDVLGVRPLRGRTLVPADSSDAPSLRNGEPPRVIVLSYGLWQRRFGGDPAIIGTRVPVAGGAVDVVGVMPPDFRPLYDEEYWVPLPLRAEDVERRGRWAMVIARLREGVPLARAQTEMRTIAGALAKEYPDFDTGWTADVVPLKDDIVGDARLKLWIALGAVALVLLIACANVVNLTLVRAAARRHEMAVRTALGASRGRRLRLWLAESALLTLLGVGLGLALAWAAVRGVVALGPADLPRLDAVRLDAPVFAFAALTAVAVTLGLGLAAAFSGAAGGSDSLQRAGTRVTPSARARRLRNGLVVAQVSLALVLLAGAGLLARTLQRLERVDPGFEPDRVLTGVVTLPPAVYHEPERWNSFFDDLESRLTGRPGVQAVGVVSFVPFAGVGAGTSFRALDRPEPPPGEWPVATIRIADAGYFDALRIPILRGRSITASDDTLPYVVVNRALARQLWPGADPIGKRLLVHWRQPDRPYTVVGVAGDTPTTGLDETVRPMIYYAPATSPTPRYTVVLRTAGDPDAARDLIPRTVQAIDPTVPVRGVMTMEERLGRSLAGHRSPAALLGLFAALALVLAAVGLYGVLAYTVSLRAKEISVRVALGARIAAVVWLIVRNGLTLTGVGLLIGVVGALGATRVLRGMLFDTPAADPLTYLAAAAVLLAAALLASWLPAHRAARLDPAEVIRAE